MKCVSDIQKLSETCNKPVILVLSSSPGVRGVISYMCAQAAKMDMKFEILKMKIVLMDKLSDAAGKWDKSLRNGQANANNVTVSKKWPRTGFQ